MVLHAEGAVALAPDALHRAVEQIDVGHGQGRAAQAARIHRVGMVLRGDFDFSRVQIPDGVVAAPVAELELVGPRPVGEAEDLMAQADAEDRILPQQGSHGLRLQD